MQHLTKAIIFAIVLLTSNTALGASEITLNDIERPESAILLIVDGLGASYYYPELAPFALDGSELSRAGTQNLAFGARIINISTPYPDTGIAHSVIVTGFSEANEEIVGYPDATIYDITRRHGFFNIGVMEKGDFMNMREEQDIVLYAENNSIDDPKISVQSKNPPPGVMELMNDWKEKLPEYMDGKSGVGKYSAYNKWALDAASAVAMYMIEEHPKSKFFLTVNVGAIDSGGHNMGDDDYIRLIEDLDRDIYPLYETAKENGMAFFFTADHGMAFAKKNARRGGHVSEKYVSMKESLRIPFVMMSPNAVPGLISGGYGEEDIAPTILSVLDLPNHLQYADGTSVRVKNYASIFVKADSEYRISLWDGGTKLSEQSASELIFAGLPLNTSYTVKASGSGGTFEEKISLDADRQFRLDNNKTGLNQKQMAAGILIIIVNVAGLAIIRRIK